MSDAGTLATPVLLLTFNRPDTTAQVLEAIRGARPERLFIAADGPRTHVPQDAEKVAETRALIDRMVDWHCTVEKRYSDVNQGCRVGVSEAITWFFDHVEEGIILEDDCVPHPDFFSYCTELLHRYRDDLQVMHIGASNSAELQLSDSVVSYGFARQPLVWGWATWRRAWTHYDSELKEWQALRLDTKRKRDIWPDPVERRWQTRKLDRLLAKGEPNSWAYRWSFTVERLNGLSITPMTNLITNIGFGPDATHTQKVTSFAGITSHSIFPMTHPAKIELDPVLERQIFDRIHGGAKRRVPMRRLMELGLSVVLTARGRLQALSKS